MMKLNSNVACIEYKNKVILANKLTGMWLRITKEIYNYFIKALELNYERKDFVRSFMREEDQIYMCTYGNCQNLVSKYHIRYDGYVYACQTIEDRKYSLGHIDQISEFDKITNNNLMLMIEDLLKFNHKCRRCKVMPFCWKCPVEIMEYTKNGSMREHCNTVHDNLFHVIWEE